MTPAPPPLPPFFRRTEARQVLKFVQHREPDKVIALFLEFVTDEGLDTTLQVCSVRRATRTLPIGWRGSMDTLRRELEAEATT